MGVRILHFADLHLDKSFADLATVSREAPVRRRADLRRVLARIVDLSIKLGADYLTVGGDLYEHERLSPDTAAFVRTEFERAQPATVVIAPGNHDPFTIGSLYRRASWPPNVRIAAAPAIQLLAEDRGVNLYAAAHPNPSFMEDVLHGTHVETPGPNVLILHGSDRTAVPPGVDSFCPFSPVDCARAGFSLALLGHYHAPYERQIGSTTLAYPGSPDPLGFGEAGPHYALLAEIDGERVSLSRHATYVSDYRVGDLDVSEARSRSDVENMIAEWTRLQGAQEAFVRLTLVGTVTRSLDLDLAAIRVACDSHAAFLNLRADTDLELEIDPDEPTVRGRFVRKMQGLIQEATGEGERQELENALLYGLAALEGREIRAR